MDGWSSLLRRFAHAAMRLLMAPSKGEGAVMGGATTTCHNLPTHTRRPSALGLK